MALVCLIYSVLYYVCICEINSKISARIFSLSNMIQIVFKYCYSINYLEPSDHKFLLIKDFSRMHIRVTILLERVLLNFENNFILFLLLL